MAKVFIAARGCVYVTGGTSGGKGFYKLKPDLSSGSPDSPILIEGVDGVLQDIVFPVATLDDKKYFFTMGDDFGNVGVSGMVLLGTSDSKGQAFNAVRQYFESNRSAKSGSPIEVSCPGSSVLPFYLTSLVISRADPEYHIQFFQLRGIGVEPKSP